ncbi:hypothetical protein PAMP_005856 [Pampus punctatissimus]
MEPEHADKHKSSFWVQFLQSSLVFQRGGGELCCRGLKQERGNQEGGRRLLMTSPSLYLSELLDLEARCRSDVSTDIDFFLINRSLKQNQ